MGAGDQRQQGAFSTWGGLLMPGSVGKSSLRAKLSLDIAGPKPLIVAIAGAPISISQFGENRAWPFAGHGQFGGRPERADIAAHGDRRMHRLEAGQPVLEYHWA